MKFYRLSRAARLIQTALCVFIFLVGVDTLVEDHRWRGILILVVPLLQIRTLWNQYWEIAPTGTLHSSAHGFHLTYRASDVRYAGPVRVEVGYPVSKKKDLRLELEGVRDMRYVRVADRSAFLKELRAVSPQAEIVAV